jgi:hypothetical protein
VYQLVVSFDAGNWPSSGVLSQMGYHVGKSGLGATARRQILQEVFAVELVATSAETESYIREWGSPKSVKPGSHPVRDVEPLTCTEAISDWESDLAWMRSTYRL